MNDKEEMRKAFERALGGDGRYDTTTRLVYADWLEEHGDRPGDDDLAIEQRRMAAQKWVDADKRMHDRARGHTTCDNYGGRVDCPECGGAGYIETGGREDVMEVDCADCSGRGWIPSPEGEIDREITYDDLMKAGLDYVESGGEEYFTQMGSESLRSDLSYDKKAREQYWADWCVITGKEGPKTGDEKYGIPGPFSCSC